MPDPNVPDSGFDKTVKLDAAGAGARPDDKTIKLTPADEKTIVLSPQKPAPAAPAPTPPPPPMPGLSDAGIPPLVSLPPEAKGSSAGKIAWIAAAAAVLLGAAAWLALPPLLKSQARNLSSRGSHADAAKYLKWALVLRPADAPAYWLELGKALRLSQDYAGAQKALEKSLMNPPDTYYAALKESGLAQKEMGLSQGAYDALKTYAAVRPAEPEILDAYAQAAFNVKDYKTAAEAYEGLVRAGQADAGDLFRMGGALLALGKTEEARQSLESAAEKARDMKGIHELLSKAYLALERPADAVGAMKMEISLSPNEPALAEDFAGLCLQAAAAAAKDRKWDEGIRHLQEGLGVASGKTASLHYELARLYAGKKNRREALSHLKDALAADPALKPGARREAAFSAWARTPDFIRLTR